MEVLIVSKTHMSTAACVGGLVLVNNRYVRLLNPGNYNQSTDTDFEVGEIYDITFTDRVDIHPPHIEDVIITSKRFLRRVDDMPNFITQRNILDWNGHIDNLFDGFLSWTDSGTGYIPLEKEMPNQSVGFWISNRELIKVTFGNKVRYRYPNGRDFRNISYVGYQETLETIPTGTILRVSLSRVFPPEVSEINSPRGYYLQLSGWYKNGRQVNQPIRRTAIDIEKIGATWYKPIRWAMYYTIIIAIFHFTGKEQQFIYFQF